MTPDEERRLLDAASAINGATAGVAVGLLLAVIILIHYYFF